MAALAAIRYRLVMAGSPWLQVCVVTVQPCIMPLWIVHVYHVVEPVGRGTIYLFICLLKFLFDFFLGFLSYLFTFSGRDVKDITIKSSGRHYVNKFTVTLITCTLGLGLGEETHDTYMLAQWVYYTLWQDTGLYSHLHCINQDNHAVCTVSLYRVTGYAI